MSQLIVLLFVPTTYVLLQYIAYRNMRQGWKVAAALPGFVMVASLLLFVVGIATNASYAPVALILGLPLATLYLIVLYPLHWLTAPRAQNAAEIA